LWGPWVGEVGPPPPREFREVAARPRGRGALVGGLKMLQCQSSIHEQ